MTTSWVLNCWTSSSSAVLPQRTSYLKSWLKGTKAVLSPRDCSSVYPTWWESSTALSNISNRSTRKVSRRGKPISGARECNLSRRKSKTLFILQESYSLQSAARKPSTILRENQTVNGADLEKLLKGQKLHTL